MDLSLEELWHAAVATDAFRESQEVSNCQHFVLETLQQLALRPKGLNMVLMEPRGHLEAKGGMIRVVELGR